MCGWSRVSSGREREEGRAARVQADGEPWEDLVFTPRAMGTPSRLRAEGAGPDSVHSRPLVATMGKTPGWEAEGDRFR